MASQCTCSKPPIFVCGYNLRGYLGQTYVDSEGNIIQITPEQFAEFIPVIAAAFPDGFTIYDALGGYYDSVLKKTVTERTKVLEVVVDQATGKDSIRTFQKVMNTYTVQFHQSGEFYTKSNCQFHSE